MANNSSLSVFSVQPHSQAVVTCKIKQLNICNNRLSAAFVLGSAASAG